MTGADHAAQEAVLARAIEAGINWIDTAASYGDGASESNLGRALAILEPDEHMQIATKVRVDIASLAPGPGLRAAVRNSVVQSLQRLRRSHVTLLQLHNGLTRQRGDEAATVCPDDVLQPGGIADALEHVRDQGLTRFIGLTGTGHPESLRTLIRSQRFDTIQLPYNRLNPSAGCASAPAGCDRDYGNILADCLAEGLGVFAIRVLAGGAMLGAPPSAHTLRTPYFPLWLYEQNVRDAAEWNSGKTPAETVRRSIEFALSHPAVHSAIIGFGAIGHVEDALSS
jgi:aryl-alcohol dehydrogenase-like predicted oxidoreductase